MMSQQQQFFKRTCHPLLLLESKRNARRAYSVTRQHHQSGSTHASTLARWSQNYSRLYARRILELAAASAATWKATTEMKEAIQKPPSQWLEWTGDRTDWAQESLAAIGSTTLERYWNAAVRIANLSLLASPIALLLPLSYIYDQPYWEYCLWGIEQAGPTFIKFVQWATTRQDLFSPAFCHRFGKLRDQTRGHAWKDTVKILEKHGLLNVLQLDHAPIGSGCIAQVYKGTLLQDTAHQTKGTELAIKVQHPNILHKVCVDFFVLDKIASFLESIPFLDLRYLSLRDTVQQFCNIMLPQLDLKLEAKHLQRFRRDFGSDPQVHFPAPVEELTKEDLLVETFCTGQPILSFGSADFETRKSLANLGLQTTLKMIFLHDFVHGDLHPGNILVNLDKDGKPHLTLLDCGLVIEFGPEQHATVIKILAAFVRRDGTLAGQLMVDNDRQNQASTLDVQLFVQGIQQICVDDQDQNFVEHVGDYIADICYLACRHKVKLDAAFINAALAVELMEGIATTLYPSIQVSSTALPMVMKAEMMHRLSFGFGK